ncbi:MAG: hypothetical protein WB510_02560 [Candidatus Sulfotelmatobacter sp.]
MKKYDVVGGWDQLDSDSKARVIHYASDEELEKWASDPSCNQQLLSAAALTKRGRNMDQIARATRLQANPFDSRTEVSADARHIVKHLWIIFVALPFVLAILYAIWKSVLNN